MPQHPSSQSLQVRGILTAAVLAATGGLWILLAKYGDLPAGAALADSAAYMALLSGAGYFYWYAVGHIRGFATKAAIAVAVQLLCIGLAFAVTVITGVCSPQEFSRTIPLHLIYGLLLWAILSGWYYIFALAEEKTAEAEGKQEVAQAETPRGELIDRISVKKGSEIEIIPVGQLMYIQAYGDYVMIHTEDARHIKEQTMKFYETSLPETFVRVHRSFIVNTDRIARVELAGKENYTIKLKNGVAIRASAAGYKLLRQRLSL